jgi:hypothetical protein
MVRDQPPRDHSSHRSRQEPAMNFMTHQPMQQRPALVRTPIHELALVAIIEDDGRLADEESFSRCGWFDSSLELAAGLQVIEFVEALPDGLAFEAVL